MYQGQFSLVKKLDQTTCRLLYSKQHVVTFFSDKQPLVVMQIMRKKTIKHGLYSAKVKVTFKVHYTCEYLHRFLLILIEACTMANSIWVFPVSVWSPADLQIRVWQWKHWCTVFGDGEIIIVTTTLFCTVSLHHTTNCRFALTHSKTLCFIYYPHQNRELSCFGAESETI